MLPSFCRDTVTVIRPKMVDQRGSLVPDYTQATESTLSGVSVQPSSTADSTVEVRFNSSFDAIMYAPANADIQRLDRIRWRTFTFDVDGVAMPWVSASGSLDHMVVHLAAQMG